MTSNCGKNISRVLTTCALSEYTHTCKWDLFVNQSTVGETIEFVDLEITTRQVSNKRYRNSTERFNLMEQND